MKTFLEYITLNYTWFLGGTIVILLAIIGSYADKTNFGDGKTKEQESDKIRELQLEKLKLQQQLEEAQKTQKEEVKTEIGLESNKEQAQQNLETLPLPEVSINEEKSNLETLEEQYAEFDKQFDELLPKKGFDDKDLLDEINSISLDKTQKIDITEIPILDDVDLPKIKTLDPIDEDIWKF